jgi:Fe2+ or Zn2+ uptake regulation protein
MTILPASNDGAAVSTAHAGGEATARATLAAAARKARVSNTKHRTTILDVLLAASVRGEVLAVAEIGQRSRVIDPSMTDGAIHRALTAFRRAGLVVKVAKPTRGYVLAPIGKAAP